MMLVMVPASLAIANQPTDGCGARVTTSPSREPTSPFPQGGSRSNPSRGSAGRRIAHTAQRSSPCGGTRSRYTAHRRRHRCIARTVCDWAVLVLFAGFRPFGSFGVGLGCAGCAGMQDTGIRSRRWHDGTAGSGSGARRMCCAARASPRLPPGQPVPFVGFVVCGPAWLAGQFAFTVVGFVSGVGSALGWGPAW